VLPLCYEEKPQNLPPKKTENNKKAQTSKMLKKVKTKLEIKCALALVLAHKN